MRRRTSEQMAASDIATFQIFISYRRGDSEAYAGRLYDHVTRPFGSANIFMDVDDLPPGQDYVEALEAAVAACDVLLAVVGPGWLAATSPHGERRLDSDLDWVRIEIASALSGGKRVIPLLFGGADMPRQDELPDPLKPLARRQAVEFRHEHFASDASALVMALRRFREEKQATSSPSRPAEAPTRPRAIQIPEGSEETARTRPPQVQPTPRPRAIPDEQNRYPMRSTDYSDMATKRARMWEHIRRLGFAPGKSLRVWYDPTKPRCRFVDEKNNVNFERLFDDERWHVWESFPVASAERIAQDPVSGGDILESMTFVSAKPKQHSPFWTEWVNSTPANIRKAYLDGYALGKPGQWWGD
jgi:hypothetical protein